MTEVSCGIDWAEGHHDIALVDSQGTLLASQRVDDSAAGLAELLDLLSTHGDRVEDPIPAAIETPRGLLAVALRTNGRAVYAINPMAVARYREQHTVSRKKSDAQDAAVLANTLRTDRHAHRPLPQDSELVQSIAVLACAQQDAVWDRQQHANRIRSLLREYYPSALKAFPHTADLSSPAARLLLRTAPPPSQAAALTGSRLRRILLKSGRTRNIEATVARLLPILREAAMHQLPGVEAAFGSQLTALLGQFNAACDGLDALTLAVEGLFVTHPDAGILTSFPGVGPIAGARVLAEIGDDRTRFVAAGSLKAYAGSAPVTRASGKSHTVLARRVKNNRLAAAGYVWAFSALTRSLGARAHVFFVARS
jgi:transposase